MDAILNVKIGELFTYPPGADISQDFVGPNQQMDKDYMRLDSVETDKFKAIQDGQRADQARQYDADNAHVQALDPNENPGQQVGPYAYLERAASQAQGFQNKQARKNIVAGVLADISNDTLVGGRVIFKTAKKRVEGTVIAVGDAEFAVIWDDKTASVERKADYELVVTGDDTLGA